MSYFILYVCSFSTEYSYLWMQFKKLSLMDSVGDGEGGEIWENGIETCIISCMKRVASPGSMHDTGCLGLVHWDDPEGWCGDAKAPRHE